MEDFILIALLLLMLAGIIVFNVIALINYGKSFELNIVNTGVKCKYENLKVAQKCPNSDGSFCYSQDNNIYLLGRNPISFTQVCSTICKPTLGSTSCDSGLLELKFKSCISDIQPPKKCTDVAKALALDQNGNYLYAQELFSGNG